MILAPIETSLSTKNRRLSNIFSKMRIVPRVLSREHDGDRRQVGGKRGPGPVLDLGDRLAQVIANDEVLAGGDTH